jgi:hypothetical protein
VASETVPDLGDRFNCEAAYSLTASKLDAAAKRWRRLVVHSVVSEDAPFDARRSAPVKPPPRFVG